MVKHVFSISDEGVTDLCTQGIFFKCDTAGNRAGPSQYAFRIIFTSHDTYDIILTKQDSQK